ncbi:MAG: hypothetical protein RIC16_09135 [Rhodospirillales bacterium]
MSGTYTDTGTKDGTTFRFWPTLWEIVRLPFARFPALVRVSIVPFALFALANWGMYELRFAVWSVDSATFDERFDLFLITVLGVETLAYALPLCLLPFAVQWTRSIIHPDHSQALIPRLNRNDLHYGTRAAILYLIYLIAFAMILLGSMFLYFVVQPIHFNAVAADATVTGLVAWHVMALVLAHAAGLFLVSGACLIVATAASEHPLTLPQSWALSSGVRSKTFTVLFLVTSPIAVGINLWRLSDLVIAYSYVDAEPEFLGAIITDIFELSAIFGTGLVLLQAIIITTAIGVIYRSLIVGKSTVRVAV